MSKGLKISLVVVGIIAVIAILFGGMYNGMVSSKENVDTKYADISVQLQRRADLIPNLVATVKGYVEHEEETINSVNIAREKLISANSVSDKANANNELTTALTNLMVIVENYPDLKANTNFIQLQDELAGTENRIAVSRKDYNDAVKEYNTSIKRFPKNIFAGMFGFDVEKYFEATSNAGEVPNVNFD